MLPQALQLYVQLLHISEPSPRSNKFASESRRVPQVLQRKQFKCHLLPAIKELASCPLIKIAAVDRIGKISWGMLSANWATTENDIHSPSSKAFPSSSICHSSASNRDQRSINTYVSTSFTRVCHIITIHRRIQIIARRFHAWL